MSEEWSEEWLYGESADGPGEAGGKPQNKVSEGQTDSGKTLVPDDTAEGDESSGPRPDETAAGEGSGAEEDANGEDAANKEGTETMEEGGEGGNEDRSDDDEDDDDDSDDDGVQVHIGDIKAEAVTAQPAAFGSKRVAGPPPDKKGKFTVDDFEATGTINGVPVQDFSLDSIEEKPWRKPGADITDYFNYGFTEETWRAYTERQKRLRYEAGSSMPQMDRERKHHIQSSGSSHVTNIPIIGSDNSKYGQQQNVVFPKKFGNQDRQKDPQQRISRNREEPRENTIQVMTADRREYSRKSFDMPQMPPPPFDMSVPPPTFGRPPPEVFHGGPPPDFFGHPPPQFFPGDGPPHPHHQLPNPHNMMHQHPHPHHPPPHHGHMDYEEQQWMDSSWESNMNRPPMQPMNSTVVPIMKMNLPPPPGESDDLDKDKDKS